MASPALHRLTQFLLLSSLPLGAVLACSADNGGSNSDQTDGGASSGSSSSGGSTKGGNGGLDVTTGTTGGSASTGGGSSGVKNIYTTLPAGFTKAAGRKDGGDSSSLKGGYKMVGALADVDVTTSGECSNIIRALVRDFADNGSNKHTDFGRSPPSDSVVGGLVDTYLSSTTTKPVPTGKGTTANVADKIGEWYESPNTAGAPFNTYVVDFWLEPDGSNYTFYSSRFFPLEGAPLYGGETTTDDDDKNYRNFGFTTEIHTQFRYNGGEIFNFRGDDDVWVFIGDTLAMDLGGIHSPASGSMALDLYKKQLGLTVGETYALHMFHAERHKTGSNFQLSTSLDFTGCGEILKSDIIIK